MSHDAQYRKPEPLYRLGEILRARLVFMGYPFTGELLSCACCGQRSILHCKHDIIEDDWMIGCSRCGATNERAYADPIRAILFWNQNQIERWVVQVNTPAADLGKTGAPSKPIKRGKPASSSKSTSLL